MIGAIAIAETRAAANVLAAMFKLGTPVGT